MKPRLSQKHPFLAKLEAWSQKTGIKPRVRAKAEKSKNGKKLKMSILGPIGAFYFDSVTDAQVSHALDEEDPDEVDLTINSPGGDAFMGIAIYNLLKGHRAKVTVRVVGEAASAAGIISQAGDEIIMGRGAMLMIHNAWTLTLGDWNDHKSAAKLLRKLDRSQADILSSRSELEEDEALRLMAAETWFTASEAVAKGLADKRASDEDEDFEDLDEDEETTLRTSDEEDDEEASDDDEDDDESASDDEDEEASDDDEEASDDEDDEDDDDASEEDDEEASDDEEDDESASDDEDEEKGKKGRGKRSKALRSLASFFS